MGPHCLAMDVPPYVEEDRPPTYRPPALPAPVAPRGVLGTATGRMALIVGGCIVGGVVGFILPYLLSK